MRAFVAIDLIEAARAAAAKWSQRLREATPPGALAFVRPESFHLTLQFLGDVPDETAPGLAAALDAAVRDLPAFHLSLFGLGAFPSVERARVVWIGTSDGAEACRELAERVQAALIPAGAAPADKPFSPHLTLARVKRPAKARAIPALLRRHAAEEIARFRVDAVTLFRSELLPEGAKHTAISVARLRGETR